MRGLLPPAGDTDAPPKSLSMAFSEKSSLFSLFCLPVQLECQGKLVAVIALTVFPAYPQPFVSVLSTVTPSAKSFASSAGLACEKAHAAAQVERIW